MPKVTQGYVLFMKQTKTIQFILDFQMMKKLTSNGNGKIPIYKINYEGKVIERNFFETLGGLTVPQIIGWLTGKGEISNCYKTINADMDAWRKNYWDAFEVKNYQKLKHWSYEEEYRVAISNEFSDLNDAKSRLLEYDPQNVKGIIFGIRTTEYDKKRIFELLKKKKDVFKDFTFYQAEYNEMEQKIKVREKRLWKL